MWKWGGFRGWVGEVGHGDGGRVVAEGSVELRTDFMDRHWCGTEKNEISRFAKCMSMLVCLLPRSLMGTLIEQDSIPKRGQRCRLDASGRHEFPSCISHGK